VDGADVITNKSLETTDETDCKKHGKVMRIIFASIGVVREDEKKSFPHLTKEVSWCKFRP
jgi:hypothetical protein